MYSTFISAAELAAHINDDNWRIVDCRFTLKDTEKGRNAYRVSHIPNAVYAHLDDDLSGEIIAGKTGRHPLPDPETLAATFSRWGIDRNTQVVAYDDMGGAIASRLWWMLRWMGHTAVAVLERGWQGWLAENHPVSSESLTPQAREFLAEQKDDMLVDIKTVTEIYSDPQYLLLDARAAARYCGEMEPIDPVAGHIPNALNLPFKESMNEDQTVKSREILYRQFREKLGNKQPSENVVSYCGSGVTGCFNVLAMNHAGLGMAKLYAGSWSEWIVDESRPNGLDE